MSVPIDLVLSRFQSQGRQYEAEFRGVAVWLDYQFLSEHTNRLRDAGFPKPAVTDVRQGTGLYRTGLHKADTVYCSLEIILEAIDMVGHISG